MTPLAVLLLVVGLVCLATRRGYAAALALAGCTPVGAALVLGAVAVPTFYAAAIGVAVALALQELGHWRSPDPDRVRIPGSRALLLLALTAVLVTVLAPLLFDGLVTPGPSGPVVLVAGVVTKSNVAQIVYLLLGLCVVFFVARSPVSGVWLVGVPAIGAVLLSLWAWAGTAGLPFPVGFFDNSPYFVFQETLPGGEPRVRGIFSEPAGLASASVVLLAYGASRLPQARGAERWVVVAAMAAAAYLGSISTSTTFYVAGALVAVLGVVVAAGTFATGAATSSRAALLGVGLSAAAVIGLPAAADALSGVIEDKTGSSSYSDRGAANAAAVELVWTTHGFGTGLGTTRASSFAATLLASLGVVGTVLFITAVVVVLRVSWGDRTVRPAAWALIALLTCKLVSGPDLNDTSGILWLSLGVLAASAVRRRARLARLDLQAVDPTGPALTSARTARHAIPADRPPRPTRSTP